MHGFLGMQRQLADKAEIDAGKDNPFPAFRVIGQIGSQIGFQRIFKCSDLIGMNFSFQDIGSAYDFQRGAAVVLADMSNGVICQVFIFFCGNGSFVASMSGMRGSIVR